MSKAYQDLRKKLSELFQLDAAAELDFGIYRILNARRVEISEFLDSLEGQVDRVLAEAMGSGAGEARAELAKAEADLRSMGLDDAALAAVPKIRELRDKVATSASDPSALSHEIFSHLATFFSRYYQDGDFISLRRYKKDTYAIPYEGEEVKLHWANADQYYIKSSETLRDYSFRLGPAPKGDKPDSRPTVTFKLVEADVEKDNAKAVAGQERRFVFQGLVESDVKDHLILGFAYLPLGKAEKQAALNEAAAKAILTEHAKGPFTDLAAKDPTYTGSQKGGRSILAKHLTEYTGRNTFDYFIHKDLGGFLRRELDFYIKNEVLHLDDLDEAPEANWNETRAKLKALRSIAAKVIRFLAQLEDFQKKLWLKKKFVTACDYVVTLDRIPEELYPEIAACEAQREEWVRLFAIDEIKSDLGRTGYSVPLTMEFLKENQGLPLSTLNFSESIKHRLIQESGYLYKAVNGVAICAENFQGLVSTRATFLNAARCAYIDPPYNTGNDGFPYKDTHQHSSWMTMMENRLIEIFRLLSPNGHLFASIDENEVSRLVELLKRVAGDSNYLGELIWQGSSKNDQKYFSFSHEYLLIAFRDKLLCDANSERWLERKPGLDEIYAAYQKIKKEFQDDYPAQTTALKEWFSGLKDSHPAKQWSHYCRAEKRGIYFPDNISKPAKGYFYDVPHPVTGRVCKPPKGGYRFVWETMQQQLSEDLIHFGPDETTVPCRKSFLHETEFSSPRSVIYQDGRAATKRIESLFGSKDVFSNPKDHNVLARLFAISCPKDAIILDPFAGSGTTADSVIQLNREDGGDRKYILIEMGEHFDTVLVPRLKKVIYSKDWKDGKPQNRNTGISHCFKILRLESYEDTLNNLRLSRTRAQELALESMTPEAREDYRLGYMLDLEASGSPSLLNVSAFTDPWNYTMEIASGTAGETKTTKVDLVETFNWLLGLTVLAQGHGGGVQWVEGTNPEGDKVLVLWRNTTEVDADALNDWCKKQKISVLDGEFGLIYINGDHHLDNLRRDDQTWKVRLTDEEFPKLMWEGCE